MKARPSDLVLAAVAAILFGLSFHAVDAHAYRLTQARIVNGTAQWNQVACGNSNGHLHWNKSAVPMALNTANQRVSGLGASLARTLAYSVWNGVTPSTYSIAGSGTTTRGKSADGVNVQLWGNPGCTNCLAVTYTTVYLPSQQIFDADIIFNTAYSWGSTSGAYDYRSVLTHEVGHVFGIGHSEVTAYPKPTMHYQYFGTDMRSLEVDDRSALNCIYYRYRPSTSAALAADLEAASESIATESSSFEHTLPPAPSIRLSFHGGVNADAVLRYSLPSGDDVRLDIFDVSGRKVATLDEGHREAGNHEVTWNGSGRMVGARQGVYFARLITTRETARTTVILNR